MGACWWLLSLDQTQHTGHFGLQTKSPLFFSPLKGKKNHKTEKEELIHDLAYIAAVFGHGCKVDMSIARYRNCWKRGLSGLAVPWQREAGEAQAVTVSFCRSVGVAQEGCGQATVAVVVQI